MIYFNRASTVYTYTYIHTYIHTYKKVLLCVTRETYLKYVHTHAYIPKHKYINKIKIHAFTNIHMYVHVRTFFVVLQELVAVCRPNDRMEWQDAMGMHRDDELLLKEHKQQRILNKVLIQET